MAYILCVDDEESISILVKQVLQMAGHEVEVAAEGRVALDSIATREPDLVVLDWSMPMMDGLEVCRTVKENPFTSRIPILMLTALVSLERKIEGFEAGADDYLPKPFEPRELVAHVARLLRLVQREGDRNPSSGLPGGRAISQAIETRVEKGEPFAVCYLDFDHFKPFADTFGFQAADEVIARSGALLGELAGREGEFAGHIGGDDFLLLAAPDRAESLSREITKELEAVVHRAVGHEAVEKGSFGGLDRSGEPRQWPLTRVSSVILQVEPQNWRGVAHLGEAAATWKKAAKANGDGVVVVAAA